MLTLCIDTAYRYLTVALIRDERILAAYSKECFKKQSEEVFGALAEVFTKAEVGRKDIDSLCISEGPGSYTGVRIAMTIAKTIADLNDLEVYTISTLRLYASLKEKAMVLMDARANRAYVGIYDKEKVVMEDCAMPIEEIKTEGYDVYGDGSLLGMEDSYPDIAEAFLKCRPIWRLADNVAYLAPKYLKESESYYR